MAAAAGKIALTALVVVTGTAIMAWYGAARLVTVVGGAREHRRHRQLGYDHLHGTPARGS